jgi:hypothetical protein
MQKLYTYSDISFIKRITFEHLKNIRACRLAGQLVIQISLILKHAYTHIHHPLSTEQIRYENRVSDWLFRIMMRYFALTHVSCNITQFDLNRTQICCTIWVINSGWKIHLKNRLSHEVDWSRPGLGRLR